MTFGQRIQGYRKELGMSQDKLASMMYVTRQSVSQWENDKTMPSVDLLLKLSDIFGVTVDVLLGKDEPVQEAEPVASSKIITDKKRLKQCRNHILLSTSVILVSAAVGLFIYIFLQMSIYPKAFEGIKYSFNMINLNITAAAGFILLGIVLAFTIYSFVIFKADLRYYSILKNSPDADFFDDRIVIKDGNGSPLSFSYQNMSRIFETDNFIVFHTENKRRFYIDKHEIEGDAEKLMQAIRGCKKYRRKFVSFKSKKHISEKTAAAVVWVSNILFVFSIFSVEYEVLFVARIMTDADLPIPVRWIMIITPYLICAATLILGIILTIRKIKAVRLIVSGAVMLAVIVFLTIPRMPFYTFQQHRVMPEEFKECMEAGGFDVKETNEGRTELLLMDCLTATSKERGYEIVYYNFLDESSQSGHVYAAELYNKCVTETKMFARRTLDSNYLNLTFNCYFTAESEDKYCYVSLNKYSIIYVMTDIENKDDVAKAFEDYKMPIPY